MTSTHNDETRSNDGWRYAIDGYYDFIDLCLVNNDGDMVIKYSLYGKLHGIKNGDDTNSYFVYGDARIL